MFNFFRKKREDEIWYDFFQNLFQYCVEVNDFINVDCDFISNDHYVEYVYTTFPHFYNCPKELERFKKLPYKSLYDVLNSIYKKANITLLDTKESEENKVEYDMWKIKISQAIERESLCFIVLFVTEENGKNSYRILYYYSFEDTIEDIVNNIKDMPLNFSKDGNNKEAQQFLKTMIALAKYASIEIPADLQDRFPALQVEMPVSVNDFERIIALVNLNPFDRDVKKTAQEMYDKFRSEKPIAPTTDPLADFEDTSFSGRFDLLNHETNIWETDWKFDPEDAEDSIDQILLDTDISSHFEENWTFDYPDETYSYDLFPYIQESLAKIGFVLMNIDNYADHYSFFIIRKENLDEVLKLSKKLVLEYDQCII